MTGGDGATYGIVVEGFQDGLYHLVRLEEDGVMHLRAEIVGMSDDFQAPGVRLVRPLDGERRERLAVGPDGRVIVFSIREGCASIALDTTSGRVFHRDGEASIGELSPFVLLDARDELDPGDLVRLRGDYVRCPGSSPLDELDEEILSAASRHPNPTVRELVVREPNLDRSAQQPPHAR